ncbi:hypothetical protein LTS18_012245 [Coniosporium uncinatum]|uniref:Uncharacterized protein n=1 Tax=Coniosporium uncinatum TaxID=93489 RepID=A0ACC3DJC5_9PEZI|nr:hypothetical protein LTS18_012245 [Coniosporium uncinatum]
MDPPNPRRNSSQHPSRTQSSWRRSSNSSPSRHSSDDLAKTSSAPLTSHKQLPPGRAHSISSPPSTANIPSLSRNPFVRRKPETLPPKLPKEFDTPMTCFFWYQHGRCSKSDDECIYAHMDTGHYANPPVSTGMGDAVAGKRGDVFLSLTAVVGAEDRSIAVGERAAFEREKEAFEKEKAKMKNGVRIIEDAARELQQYDLGGAAETAVEEILGAVKAMDKVD